MIWVVDVACVIFSVIASRGSTRSYFGWLVVTSVPAAAWWALAGVWHGVALAGSTALIGLVMWWRRRRKGRGRARALLSRKYAHVRAKLVRALRERRTARPVLAPGRA